MDQDDLLKRSLDAIRTLRGELAEERARAAEPVAVVGMACRFPGGADTPERFWELLVDGRDAVAEVPADRWPAELFRATDPHAPGKAYTAAGGFLDEDIDAFDAAFFGMSPGEAAAADPQHRLLLETAWEALERGGLLTDGPDSGRIGVFVGISGSEHTRVPVEPRHVGSFTGIGAAPSMAAGRVAHALGLHGPALAVDTACSSSLVSVHLALESLRRRACDAAVAGGVNVMLSPDVFVVLSKMQALSRQGRCKVFDASADGYVRAEGCGTVALMRLSDAVAAGVPVHAVIRGSAVNHDGSTSGLTVPNGRAQRELIREALANAGVAAEAVGYLETHGTGTPLGDPIEVGAAAEVLCANRTAAAPLRLGAVKSNIGHLEAAAGIAGLIKTVLVLEHGRIPANLHLRVPNPRLGVERLPVTLPRVSEPWAAGGTPRYAGVSSFGFSGTNAHLVLEEAGTAAPAAGGGSGARPAPASGAAPAAQVVPLSALTSAALADHTRRIAAWVRSHPRARLTDIAHTLGARRRHFGHRAALVTDREGPELAARLDDLAGRLATPAPDADTQPGAARHVGLFLDATPEQAVAAAGVLHRRHRGFRSAFDACVQQLSPASDGPLVPVPVSADLLAPRAADAVTLACQVALARLLADWGVRPAAVGGSGVGFLAAAVVAQSLDLPTAGALLAARHGAPAPHTVPSRPPAVRLLHGGAGHPADMVREDQLAVPGFWSGCAPGSSAEPSAAAAPWLAEKGYGLFVAVGGPAAASASGSTWWRVAHGDDAWTELVEGLATAYRGGLALDWAGVHRGDRPVRLDLPPYPFQRQRYAPPLPRAEAHRRPAAGGSAAEAGRSLGGATALRVLSSPLEHHQFRTSVSRALLPQLADTGGVLHVGYYQEMLAAAVRELDGGAQYEVRDAEFTHALYFAEEARSIQLTVSREADAAGDARSCTVHSSAEGEAGWTLHLHGALHAQRADTVTSDAPAWPARRDELRDRLPERIDGPRFYADLRARGLAFGPSVEWVEEAWYGDGEAVARLRPRGALEAAGDDEVLPVPVGVFDTCAQLYVLVAGSTLAADEVFLTTRVGRFALAGPARRGPLWVHFRLTGDPAPGQLTADYRLWDDDGLLVAECDGAAVRRITGAQRARMEVAAEASQRKLGPGRGDLVDRFLAASEEVRREILAAYLSSLLAGPGDAHGAGLSADGRLADLGVDSLRGMELRTRLQDDLGVQPPLDVLLHGTIAELLTTVRDLLVPGASPCLVRPVSLEPARWLRHARLTDTARLRLFCLPYGGRGASLFRTWPDALPDDVDVCPLQLPGRENRRDEQCIEDADEMVNALEQVLRTHADRPFALYGHSVGALLAYRLARRLADTHGDRLRHLFVAAFTCPSRGANPLLSRVASACQDLGLPELPAADVLLREQRTRPAEFRRALGGRLGEDFAARLLDGAEPPHFADLRLVHTYRHDPKELPLRIPVTALHGADDPVVSEEDMRAWEVLTEDRFHLDVLPGDHYFCHPDQAHDQVLKLIAQRVR